MRYVGLGRRLFSEFVGVLGRSGWDDELVVRGLARFEGKRISRMTNCRFQQLTYTGERF